jgi:hypothetical protein
MPSAISPILVSMDPSSRRRDAGQFDAVLRDGLVDLTERKCSLKFSGWQY